MSVKEPFLINPPRRLPARKKVNKNKWESPNVTEIARHVRARRDDTRHAGGKYHTTEKKRAYAKKYYKKRHKMGLANPFGETLAIVGLNPPYGYGAHYSENKKKGGVTMATRKRKAKKNAWKGDSAGHSKAAKKGWAKRKRVRTNPVRKHAKKSVYRRNPVHSRKSRRNPAAATAGGMVIDWSKPMSYLPFLATAGLGVIATTTVPAFVGLKSGVGKYAVQAGIVGVGTMGVNAILGKKHGFAFAIGSGAVLTASLINEGVKYFTGTGLMGLAEGNDVPVEQAMLGEGNSYENSMSAYEDAISGMGAFEDGESLEGNDSSL